MEQVQETPNNKTQAEQLAKKFNKAVKKHNRKRALREHKPYAAMVAEAKQIDQAADKGQMRLAQIAAQVETKYGEGSLKQFAQDTGIALCSLQRRRSVWRAWVDIKAAPPKLYSVAQELQAHPERARIVKEEPDITSSRARKLMREYKEQQRPQKANNGGGWTVEGTKRWFNDLVTRASAAIEDGPALDKVEDEILKQAIEPTMLGTVHQGIDAWIKVLNRLRPLFKNGGAS
jgi:hypothetical protein